MTANIPPNLLMHLMMSAGCWTNSPSAFHHASAGWPIWNPLAPDPEKLRQAVGAEAKSRAEAFLSGLLRYLETPYRRQMKEPPTVWRKGSARLLNYSIDPTSGGKVVLFVPSLINRYYILDLDEERSLLRYLAAHGFKTLLLDWGAPTKTEKDFSCSDYVTNILLQAIEFVHRTTGKPVNLAGYCMGGVLSLAASVIKQKLVNSLALFATPWNFHCESFKPFILDKGWHPTIEALIAKHDFLPADAIQSLFYWTDPWVFENKYRRFAEMENQKEIDEFVVLEQWVNDGVPMTIPLTRECLIGWAQKNQLALGRWQVEGQTINPKDIKRQVLMVMPENDHIVPKDCAEPLARAIPGAAILRPHAGHVSMIVGKNAKKEVWQPFTRWLHMQ